MVNRRRHFGQEMSTLVDNMFGAGELYRLERQFWLELWRVPVLDAVEEHGIEVRHYGPIRAFVTAAEPRSPLFNLILGSTAPGAVEGGHLAEALDWTESHGVDCRIPVRPDFGEPDATEDHLSRRGYRRTARWATFVRGDRPVSSPEPAEIEVDQIAEESEGFSDLLAAGYGTAWTGHGFFIGLPVRRDWRCYIAVDENEDGIGAAAMMLHHGIAQLGFAATPEPHRGKGAHLALVRRCVVDALAAGSSRLFAVTEEPLDYPHSDSTAARNLVRAGFGPMAARSLWRPPEDRLAGGRREENEDEYEEGDDEHEEGDDGDPDDARDFDPEG